MELFMERFKENTRYICKKGAEGNLQLYGSITRQIVGIWQALEEIRLALTQVVGEKSVGDYKEEV